MQIYIQATSKAKVNEAILRNVNVRGYRASFSGDSGFYNLSECPKGTGVKLFSKLIDGQPQVTDYAKWDGRKLI
jgi:hypothetical protein